MRDLDFTLFLFIWCFLCKIFVVLSINNIKTNVFVNSRGEYFINGTFLDVKSDGVFITKYVFIK